MSLDNTQREPVYQITGYQATKLVQRDGTALIALILTTTDGGKRFFLNEKDAEQFIKSVQKAMSSQGLRSIT